MEKKILKERTLSRRSVILGGAAMFGSYAVMGLSGVIGASPDRSARIYVAMLAHETNTFSPMSTDLEAFGLRFPPDGFSDFPVPTKDNMASGLFAPFYYAREKAPQYGWEYHQGPMSYGAPGGLVPKAVYEELRDELIADLKASMPVDIVALMLHGAMVAEGYDNCEADIFKHVRNVVGEKAVVGGVFDAHAHLGPKMTKYSDLLIVSKEYPHTDFGERSEELIDLSYAVLRGDYTPVSSSFDCRMIDMFHTPREPMRSFVDKMYRLEREDDEVISISLFQSFPWGDTPVMGNKILVITDNNPEKGERLAEELGRELFTLRGKVADRWTPMDEAIDKAIAVDGGPVVIADAADNPGGGAPCDSTFILQALIDRGIGNAVFGSVDDPGATEQIVAAGDGATLRVKIGGKKSSLSGKPVDLDVKVMKILRADDKGVNGEDPWGADAAWVRIKGIDVIVAQATGQVFVPAEFERFGIPLQERKLIVVKSSQHFYAGFAPIAKEVIYADTPAVLTSDLKALPFKNISRPMWPFDEDPWSS